MTLGRNKIQFLNVPTPLHRLDRISEDLGVEFYLKRDDLTNLGTGGNKLRKLEYFLHDALDQGATMLLTVGGAQTNHGRLTAAAAARYGLKSAIVAVDPSPWISQNSLGCEVSPSATYSSVPTLPSANCRFTLTESSGVSAALAVWMHIACTFTTGAPAM